MKLKRNLIVCIFTLVLTLAAVPNAYSAEVDGDTDPEPITLTVKNISKASTLTWNEISEVDYYRIIRNDSVLCDLASNPEETDATYTDSEVKSGSTYSYRIEAYVNGQENGEEPIMISSTTENVENTYLDVPVLSSISNIEGAIKLSWKKVSGATGYYVYRKTGSNNWSKIGTLSGGTSTTFEDTKVSSSTTYCYTVRAYKGTSLSTFDRTGLKSKFLATPKVNSVTQIRNGITVKWSKVTGATQYIVYRKQDKGSWKSIATVKGNSSTTYTDTKPAEKHTYSYKVRACNGNVKSATTSAVKSTTYLASPNLTKVSMSGKNITITWKKSSAATGYRVYRKTGNGSWQTLATISNNKTVSYTDKKASYGKTYSYVVKAYVKSSTTYWSSSSNSGSIKCQPAAPTITKVTPTSATSMTITWKKLTDASGYFLYRKNGNGWKRIATLTKGTTTSFVDTGLKYGKTYTYTIKAYWNNQKQYGLYSKKGVSGKLEFKSKYVDGYKLYYDAEGNQILDVEDIIGKQDSYEIKVNKQCNTVTVYAKDGKKGYTIPVKAFVCSTGNATPIGTFYTPVKYRWKILSHNVWGQWSTRITGGILFHSVWYYEKDKTTLSTKQYNRLGTTASAGCVRLTCEDAKWIYDNCELKTKVTIYNSKNPGPLGKPTALQLPSWHTWDPTDPTCKDLCKKEGCH